MWIYVLVAVAVYMVCRGPWRQVRLGSHLARMTTIVESEQTLATRVKPEALAIMARGKAYASRFPRHEVTKALVKNAQVAQRFGRLGRYQAIANLLGQMVEDDIALPLDEFMQSYA